jgi:hypothetical protein
LIPDQPGEISGKEEIGLKRAGPLDQVGVTGIRLTPIFLFCPPGLSFVRPKAIEFHYSSGSLSADSQLDGDSPVAISGIGFHHFNDFIFQNLILMGLLEILVVKISSGDTQGDG